MHHHKKYCTSPKPHASSAPKPWTGDTFYSLFKNHRLALTKHMKPKFPYHFGARNKHLAKLRCDLPKMQFHWGPVSSSQNQPSKPTSIHHKTHCFANIKLMISTFLESRNMHFIKAQGNLAKVQFHWSPVPFMNPNFTICTAISLKYDFHVYLITFLRTYHAKTPKCPNHRVKRPRYYVLVFIFCFFDAGNRRESPGPRTKKEPKIQVSQKHGN